MGNFLLFHNKKLMCRRSKFPKFCRQSQKTCKGRTSSLRPVTQEKVVLLLPSIFYRCCASVPHFLGGIGCLPSLCPMQGAPPLHPGHISFCEERNMEKKVVGGGGGGGSATGGGGGATLAGGRGLVEGG